MRFSTVVGVIVAVVVVAAIVVVGLRWRSEPTTPLDARPEETGSPRPGSGQYFQTIPLGTLAPEPSLFVPSQEPTTSPTSATGKMTTTATATIAMNEAGFSPATVTVAPGTTVTFVNNGQAAHWPASDVHPTHQLLPGFDAKQGVATGDTYAYTFTQTGTWRCHDHLMPQLTCTIVVK